MSALAGFWNFDGRPDAAQSCARMLAAQAMYGPHDSADWDAGSVALGRRLFRILPEDVYDHGPVFGGDGRFTMVADVRLDNRDDLIRELSIDPDRARGMADGAVLLAAWERWQDACFERLFGDYAFAVWDAVEQRLTLARDPMGARPLHYHGGKNFFAFASMPKGLHALPDIPRRPDEQRVSEFLALLPESGTSSFFEGVERVEVGHFAVISRAGVSVRRHWQPVRKTLHLRSDGEYTEAMRAELDNAVRKKLRGANNVVGSHLSGGFDSAAVASTAARLLAPGGGKVVAFTSVPREGYAETSSRGRFGDEGPHAAATAALYPNMEHVLIRTNNISPLQGMDRHFHLYDRPMLNLCNAVWFDAIGDEARSRKLNVMLSGQMGNMTISYDGTTLLPDLLKSGRWLRLAREMRGLVKNRYRGWPGVLAQTFAPFAPAFAWRFAARTAGRSSRDIRRYSAIRKERLDELDIPRIAKERALDLDYRPRVDGFESRLWVMRRVDLGNWNKGTLAGWGFEQRDPTADRQFTEFCLSLPEEQYLSNGVPKAITRRALADRLPAEILSERRKGLQAVDWHESLTAARDPLREELLRLEDFDPAATAIDVPRLRRLVENWPSEGWNKEEVMAPYRLALLRAVSTGHFLRRASGSNR